MTKSANGIQREIKLKGQKPTVSLATLITLEQLCQMNSKKTEVLSSIEQATATLAKLNPILGNNNIILALKVKLMHSLVISIYLYAVESWILTTELEKREETTGL